MTDICWLSEVHKDDTSIVGGKGANLGEMYNAGFPVPNAFIIKAQAFRKFLEDADIQDKIYKMLEFLDVNDTEELDKKTKEVREIIIKANMSESLEVQIIRCYEMLGDQEEMPAQIKEPCFVAVRSSATAEDLEGASFAGQQETFLNMKGNDNVLDAVKKCWASLFNARAVYYRKKNNFKEEDTLIAVVIQKMLNFEKAGVLFTANPLTSNRDEIVAEAVFGLGEGLVQGAIEPDHYVFNKKTGELIEKKIGVKNIAVMRRSDGKTVVTEVHDEFKKKQVVYDHELKKLYEYAVKIENHYGFPQDVEFGFLSGDFFITQSRPITTLDLKKEKLEISEGKLLLTGLAASQGTASGKVILVDTLDDLKKVQQGHVLVTKMTNPDMVVAMQKATAIVTNEGGVTCHAAIVSRELGIPCVVGTRFATKILKEDMEITVDGSEGKVYKGLLIQGQTKEQKPISQSKPAAPNLTKMFQVPNQTQNQKGPMVKVNCDLPEVAERAAATGADGVGLVRIEFMIAESGIHPAEYIRTKQQDRYSQMLANGLEKIARAFKNKPVWVRTSDIRTDEYKSLKGAQQEPKETNPMIGWHGIRRGIDDTEILKAEFKAIKILHDKGYKNIGIMIPFVIRAEEIQKAKEICRSVGLEPKKDVEFGVMVETPASCMIIEDLCREGIDFISFGTNDLTQLVLGIDRDNERIAHLYDEMHPGVLRLLDMVITVCKMFGVKTSICGQAGSRPEMAKFLKKKGISSISANIDAVQKIREAINN